MNFINEPQLYTTFKAGKDVLSYTHLDNDVNGLLSGVSMNGGVAKANIPMKQYGVYFQDDWRLTARSPSTSASGTTSSAGTSSTSRRTRTT